VLWRGKLATPQSVLTLAVETSRVFGERRFLLALSEALDSKLVCSFSASSELTGCFCGGPTVWSKCLGVFRVCLACLLLHCCLPCGAVSRSICCVRCFLIVSPAPRGRFVCILARSWFLPRALQRSDRCFGGTSGTRGTPLGDCLKSGLSCI
jgi:hypothetical protein